MGYRYWGVGIGCIEVVGNEWVEVVGNNMWYTCLVMRWDRGTGEWVGWTEVLRNGSRWDR